MVGDAQTRNARRHIHIVRVHHEHIARSVRPGVEYQVGVVIFPAIDTDLATKFQTCDVAQDQPQVCRGPAPVAQPHLALTRIRAALPFATALAATPAAAVESADAPRTVGCADHDEITRTAVAAVGAQLATI